MWGEEARIQRPSLGEVITAQVTGLGLMTRVPTEDSLAQSQSPNIWGLAWVRLAQQGPGQPSVGVSGFRCGEERPLGGGQMQRRFHPGD